MTLALCGPAPGLEEKNRPPPPPALDGRQQGYLLKLARQTILARGEGRGDGSGPGLGEQLAKHKAACGVFVRRGGWLVGKGYSEPAPLPEAVIEAAGQAGRIKRPIDGETADNWFTGEALAGCRIEVEIFSSAPQDIANAIDESGNISELLGELLEPGLDGLGVVFKGKTYRFPPSLVIATNAFHEAHTGTTFHVARLPIGELEEVREEIELFRFRSLHVLETAPGGPPMVLRRGHVLVSPDDVTLENISLAIERIGAHMLRRQRKDGTFGYEYLPSSGSYLEDRRNTLKWAWQAGPAWAMSLLARRENRALYEVPAMQAIAALERFRTPLKGGARPALIKTPGERGPLEPTALALLAILDLPKLGPDEAALLGFDAVRDDLLAGLMSLLDAAGRFGTTFPGSQKEEDPVHQFYYPGEVLLAMLTAHERTEDPAILEAAKRALDFYWKSYNPNLKPQSVPSFTQCLYRAWRITGDETYAGQAFVMTDWLFRPSKLLGPDNHPHPELYGGVTAYEDGRVGADTCVYLQGLADAIRMADEIRRRIETILLKGEINATDRTNFTKDIRAYERRGKRYRAALRAGARFILQLQVKPSETYYMPVPEEALWGVRPSLARNNLRIDNCQHAIVALLKIRDVLWPDWRGPSKQGPAAPK